MKTKIIKYSLVSLILCLSIAAVICIFLASSPGEKILKAVAESQIQKALNQPVEIHKLETNLLSRLKIDGLAIHDAAGEPAPDVIDINELKLSYNLFGILSKKLIINSVLIDTINLNIQRNDAGFYNFNALNPADTLRASGSEKTALELVLGSLDLNCINIAFDDKQIGLSNKIENCEVSVDCSGSGNYIFKIKTSEIFGVYDKLPVSIKNFCLDGSYSDAGLYIDNLSAVIGDFSFAASAEVLFEPDTIITANLLLEGSPGTLLDSILSINGLPGLKFSGGMRLSAGITGNLNSPNINGRLEIPEIKSDYGELYNLSLNAAYDNKRVLLDSMKVDLFGGRISAKAIISPDTMLTGSAELAIAGIDMERLWKTIYKEDSPYQGFLSGNTIVQINGNSIGDWKMESKIRAERARYRGKPLPDFYVNAGLADGTGSLRIHQPDFDISFSSLLKDSEIKGDFAANIENLKPLADIFNIDNASGKVKASGKITGAYESPAIKANIEAENVRYRNFPLDNLKGEISYANNELQIAMMEFSGKLDSIDQARPPFGIDSLSGAISYSGQVSGKPDSLNGNLRIELINPKYGQWGIDHAGVFIIANGNFITLTGANFSKNLITITAGGEYNLKDNTGNINLVMHDHAEDSSRSGIIDDSIEIGNIISVFELKNDGTIALSAKGNEIDINRLIDFCPDTLTCGGILDFDFSFAGDLINPEARLSVRAVKPTINNVYVDSALAEIMLADNLISVSELELHKSEQVLKGVAAMELARNETGQPAVNKNSRLKGKIYYWDWDLAILNPFLSGRAQVSGRSSLDISFDGRLEEPNISGSLKLSDCRIFLYPGSDSITDLNLTVVIDDSLLTFAGFEGILNNLPFNVQGYISSADRKDFRTDLQINISDIGLVTVRGGYLSETLDFQARIDNMDLSLLEPFMPSIKSLSGVLNSRIQALGEIDNPMIDGEIVVDKLTFQPAILSDSFTDGLIRINFDRQKMTLDTLFLRFNEGSLQAQGYVMHELGQIIGADLTASINKFNTIQAKKYEINIQTASLRYSGKEDKFLLDGDIEFGETRFLSDIKVQSILPRARSVEKAQPELPRFLQQTTLDIRIRKSDNLWIDNNLANLRLHSELGIIGSPVQPNVTGRLSIDEGYILYLDRKFKVKRGVAFFNDPHRFNPDINLLAEAKISSYQALESQTYIMKIEISGSLDELTADINSDPPLDKTDILALLTLGATRSQLSGKDSESGDVSTRDILMERAAMFSSQKISGYVSQRVGTYLGLDQVSVEGNLFKFDKSWGPQLLASKKLSNRVQLTYKTTVGHMNDQSIKLNYMLTRRFSLEGQTDRQGRSSLDFIYGLRFK
jgi:autotransporter translocation and assembly factor TamB